MVWGWFLQPKRQMHRCRTANKQFLEVGDADMDNAVCQALLQLQGLEKMLAISQSASIGSRGRVKRLLRANVMIQLGMSSELSSTFLQ